MSGEADQLRPTGSRGVVYIATGDRFHAEAAASAASVRESNPGLPICLLTDRARGNPVFDKEILIAQPAFNISDKCVNLARTPFERTLYLDSDTFVTADLTELFGLLDRFDFAGAHEIARGYWYRDKTSVPDSFPEVNGGVLLFRKSPAVFALLERWVRRFWESQSWLQTSNDDWHHHNDQVGLRQALWESPEVRITILPGEYNALRFWGTYLWGRAHIVHGRGDVRRIAGEMNTVVDHERVYLQQFGVWWQPEHMSLRQLVRGLLRATAAVGLSLVRRPRTRAVRTRLRHDE